MIDAEQLIYRLLTVGLPDITVGEDVDTNSINQFPYLVYNLNGNGQDGNGPGIWSYFLDVSLFDTTSTAFDNVDTVYDLIHGWRTDPATGYLAGVGWVQNVTDQSIFSVVDSPVISGRTVTQYAGSFALSLRN